MICKLKFTKGHTSVNEVTVLILCLASDNALMVPSFKKISRRVSELSSGHDLHTEIYKRT